MNLNIHNMDVEGTANNLSDPRSEHYWDSFKIQPVDFTNIPEKKDAEIIASFAQGQENGMENEEVASVAQVQENQTASLEAMFSKV